MVLHPPGQVFPAGGCFLLQNGPKTGKIAGCNPKYRPSWWRQPGAFAIIRPAKHKGPDHPAGFCRAVHRPLQAVDRRL
nr:MAG TPA: hypothetical protein [Caudoviricetes sp.]